MRFCRALCVTLALFAAMPAGTAVLAQPKPSPDEFVPLDEVPPEEQIPAINLVAAAYGFVWIVVVGYVWSLGRRLQRAEAEIAALERRGR
jgi:CcmD family protein